MTESAAMSAPMGLDPSGYENYGNYNGYHAPVGGDYQGNEMQQQANYNMN